MGKRSKLDVAQQQQKAALMLLRRAEPAGVLAWRQCLLREVRGGGVEDTCEAELFTARLGPRETLRRAAVQVTHDSNCAERSTKPPQSAQELRHSTRVRDREDAARCRDPALITVRSEVRILAGPVAHCVGNPHRP